MGSLLDNYTKEQLEDIVKNSFSYVEVLNKLGYKSNNGYNWRTLIKRLNYFEIDRSHFTTRSNNKEFDESKVFIYNSPVSQSTLKKRYKEIKEIEHKCAICGLEPKWNGEDLTLILDHKNGIKNDNRLENLRWVCPNCNQQLWTTGYRGIKKYNESGISIIDANCIMEKYIKSDNTDINKDNNVISHITYNKCMMCGKETINAKYCNDCKLIIKRKKPVQVVKFRYDNPDTWDYFDKDHRHSNFIPIEKMKVTRDELKNKIRTEPFTTIAKEYDVTDNAVRRWCKKYSLPYKTNIIHNISDEDWSKI